MRKNSLWTKIRRLFVLIALIPHCHPAFDVGREVWRGARCCADVGEGDGQAGRGAEIAASLQLKMQVWLGGVAGIAAAGDALAARDGLADVHIDAAGLEMAEQ